MTSHTYIEDFDHDAGGWLGWKGGGGGAYALKIENSTARTDSPWGVDFNHGPPGAGYLHMLYVLLTGEWQKPELSGPNRFVEGGYSRNFTNAALTFKLKGQLNQQGARLVLLVQGQVGEVRTNYVCTGQPLDVTPDWSTQKIIATPEAAGWTCLGSAGEISDNRQYGVAPVAELLKDVNTDIMLVLFPLLIVADPPLTDPADLWRRRAGKDYPLDRSYLPSGYVLLDQVRIDYPG